VSRSALLVGLLAAACGNDGPFTIVTIELRPAVREIDELVVTLSNDGSSLVERFTLNGQSFPVTFSVSAPGRTGALGISIAAFDRDGLLVGDGASETEIDSPAASVLLEPADFVVNTQFAEDQFPSDSIDTNGFQIAAADDGLWTVVYRERCIRAEGCHLFARRFDVNGRPVETTLAASTNAFEITTSRTRSVATPAVGAAGDTTILAWNFSEPSPSTRTGVSCRALDPAGAARGPQNDFTVETLPLAVSVAPLPGGRFVVSWNGFDSKDNIRGAIVDGQCRASNIVTASTVVGTLGARRGAVATNGDRILYAWILDGEVRGRIADANNTFLTADIPLVARTPEELVEHVRVASLGTGFAVVVRWAVQGMTSGPGRIELYRVNNGGQLLGNPSLVTTRSGSDFNSKKSFGVAERSEDGALMVVWHACEENGDESQCGVFGRLMRPSGVPVGDEINLATTRDGNQENPSVTALPGAFAATWMDESRQLPDRAGTSARARILYPAYDDARRVIGAACSSNAECGPGLACGVASDGGSRCFVTCDPLGMAPFCPAGGTCTQTAEGSSACLF
jgi:hypothetical protein